MSDIHTEGFVTWLVAHGIPGDRARWLLNRYAHMLAERQWAEAERIDTDMASYLRAGLALLVDAIDPGESHEDPPPAA